MNIEMELLNLVHLKYMSLRTKLALHRLVLQIMVECLKYKLFFSHDYSLGPIICLKRPYSNADEDTGVVACMALPLCLHKEN